jgi:hypothetical protein
MDGYPLDDIDSTGLVIDPESRYFSTEKFFAGLKQVLRLKIGGALPPRRHTCYYRIAWLRQ